MTAGTVIPSYGRLDSRRASLTRADLPTQQHRTGDIVSVVIAVMREITSPKDAVFDQLQVAVHVKHIRFGPHGADTN